MKPSRTLLALLAGLFSLGLGLGMCSALGVAVPHSLTPIYWGLLLVLLGLALVDALGLRQRPTPRIERHLPGNMPLGRWAAGATCG
jgi:hypothetical protein